MPQNGNHTRITRLLDENLHGLVLYARQWGVFHAEDVVQDAFLKLLREEPFPDSPRAWLYRVVRNASIDRVRRDRLLTITNKLDNWFEAIPENQIDGEQVTRALETLSANVREIIIAKIWSGLTFREIAELSGRPISSVHADYQQGINRLKKLLGED